MRPTEFSNQIRWLYCSRLQLRPRKPQAKYLLHQLGYHRATLGCLLKKRCILCRHLLLSDRMALLFKAAIETPETASEISFASTWVSSCHFRLSFKKTMYFVPSSAVVRSDGFIVQGCN